MSTIKTGMAIIFNGILEEEEIKDLNKFFDEDKDVEDFKFDTAEIEIVGKGPMDCTVVLITIDGLNLAFKMRFEWHSNGKLISSKENPYVYYYVAK